MDALVFVVIFLNLHVEGFYTFDSFTQMFQSACSVLFVYVSHN